MNLEHALVDSPRTRADVVKCVVHFTYGQVHVHHTISSITTIATILDNNRFELTDGIVGTG